MWLRILFLAVLQGVTEFIPISSSGHLVVFKHLLEVDAPGHALEVVLHIGSLVSIVVFFRQRIFSWCRGLLSKDKKAWQFAVALLISMLPVLIVYPVLHNFFEAAFDRPRMAALMLIWTGFVLLSLLLVRNRKQREPDVFSGGMIGLAQVLALLPGVSRSGMTISAARHLGLSADDAVEFSFLMSIPLLAGAGLLQLLKVDSMPPDISVAMLVSGAAVSAVTGYFALHVLVKVLKSGRFWMFGVYCLIAGAAGLILF